MNYKIENGLIVGPKKKQCAGYIFNFTPKGAFDPTGRIEVNGAPLTDEQIKTHNRMLEHAELAAFTKAGRGTFYLSRREREGDPSVGTWAGGWKASAYVRASFTPGFNTGKRRHVYFKGPDGKDWYGINQGNHDLVRARRMKG